MPGTWGEVTPFCTATPASLVTAAPATAPLSENATVRPATGALPHVSVADSVSALHVEPVTGKGASAMAWQRGWVACVISLNTDTPKSVSKKPVNTVSSTCPVAMSNL